MNDPSVPNAALALVERLAGAIRAELGEEIDAYPGSDSPERADSLNRAFAAIVRSILGETVASPTVVSRILRPAAEHRLATEGWSDEIIRT